MRIEPRGYQPSGPILFLDLIVLLDRPKVVHEYSPGNFTTDLVTVMHRVPPVQARPDTRVIELLRDVSQIVKRSLCLN
jgi:hypothetical protein